MNPSDDISPQLLTRQAEATVDALRGRVRRALDGNDEGRAILIAAVERAVAAGYDAWCELGEGRFEGPWSSSEDEPWARWEHQRQLTPEALRWPERLGLSPDTRAQRALEAATDDMLAAGAELGVTGTLRGWGARRALADLARQSAEAGAALRAALDAPLPESEPVEVTPAPDLHRSLGDDTVQVAVASNLPECQLIQGMLANAGIESMWTRTMDVPELLAGGPRAIHVATADAEDARRALAAVRDDAPPSGPR